MYGRLRVEVLGPLRAWLGDIEIALGTARQRATFAALVGSAGKEVAFRDLIDAVWGRDAPATAQGNLHTYVSGLRRTLGPSRELLTTTPRGYRLQLDEADVDSLAFERCRSEAGRRMLGGDLEGAVDLLSQGLGLWKGEAYSAVPGPFAELESQRLSESRIVAIEQRARILIVGGHQVEVVAEAADLVREQPLRESAWELLVLALRRCGRHAEALAAVEDARQTLARELGVEPGPALADLHAQLRADASPFAGQASATTASRHAPGPVVPSTVHEALTTRPAHPLVGRDTEIDQLRRLVLALSTGTGGAGWIEGDAGIGKSALLTAGLAEAAERGCALGWAQADELLGRFDLQVVMNCFDIELAPGGRLEAGREEDSVEDRVVDLITRTCAKAPLVMVVDDAQWADGATIELWRRLIPATRDLPLLLITSTRPHPGRTDLAALRNAVTQAKGQVVNLRPLTTSESELLIHETTGGCAPWTSARFAEQATGNPLRLVELSRTLTRRRATGAAPRPGERPARQADPEAFDAEEFDPAEFDPAEADDIDSQDDASTDTPLRATRASARRTLLSLSIRSVGVLRAAAVLGLEFTAADLALVAELTPAEIRAALDEAIVAQVLVEERGVLAFRTDPLWRAAYERIPASIRTPLRRQFTEMLTAAVGTGPDGQSHPD